MKKIKLLLWCSSLLFAVAFLSSCSKKTGCAMNDPAAVGASSNKKGILSTKRGKSNLFPKKMRKKSKKKRG